MNNALTTTTQNGSLSVYQQFKDPLEAIDKLGEWFYGSAMLAKNPGQARIMALACIVRGEDPLKLLAENMIVEGKLVRKYQMMLVDLRNSGGDYQWIEDGENGKQATIEITWKGRTNRYTFSMEMAKRAGYIKSGGGWEKLPGNMLRSKAVRQAFDMYCPEVSGGYMTPEDAEDFPATDNGKAERIAQQAAEIKATAAASVATTKPEPPPFEVEGEIEPDAETSVADVENNDTVTSSQENGNRKATPERIGVLVAKVKKRGLDGATAKQHICEFANVDSPENMTPEQCDEIIAKFDILDEIESKAYRLGVDEHSTKKHICDSAGVNQPYQISLAQGQEMVAKLDAKLNATNQVAVGN